MSELCRLIYFDMSLHCLNDPMHLIVNIVKDIFSWICGEKQTIKPSRINAFVSQNRRPSYNVNCMPWRSSAASMKKVYDEIHLRRAPGDISTEVSHLIIVDAKQKPKMNRTLKSSDWLRLAGSMGVYYVDRLEIDQEYASAFKHLLHWLGQMRRRVIDFDHLKEGGGAAYSMEQYGRECLYELEYLMPEYFCTLNLHLALHLVDHAAYTGPFYATWMFSFERYAKYLKGFVSGGRCLEETIARKIQMASALSIRNDKPILNLENDNRTFLIGGAHEECLPINTKKTWPLLNR